MTEKHDIIKANIRNFEALAINSTMSACEMALRPHSLSENGKYARETNSGRLWIWSDFKDVWRLI